MKFLLFFKAIFSKSGVRNWLILQNEIFKASDAFILPYKYSLLFLAKWMDGEILSPNPIKNFERSKLNYERKNNQKTILDKPRRR